MNKKVTVHVPATSANLGPGFDVLGVALRLYNEVSFSADVKSAGPYRQIPLVSIDIEGEGTAFIAAEPVEPGRPRRVQGL